MASLLTGEGPTTVWGRSLFLTDTFPTEILPHRPRMPFPRGRSHLSFLTFPIAPQNLPQRNPASSSQDAFPTGKVPPWFGEGLFFCRIPSPPKSSLITPECHSLGGGLLVWHGFSAHRGRSRHGLGTVPFSAGHLPHRNPPSSPQDAFPTRKVPPWFGEGPASLF